MTKKLYADFYANKKLSALLRELPCTQAMRDEFYETVKKEAEE